MSRFLTYLQKAFLFGSEEEGEFRYIGMNLCQTREGIKVDYKHYIEAIEIPEIEEIGVTSQGLLDEEGQTLFRSIVARINTIGYQCRPDVVFETKVLSAEFGKASKQSLKLARKELIKIKSGESSIKFPNIGNMADWVIVGHGDAGIRSLPDKQTSVGGQVVMICNRKSNKTCVISWRAKKIRRKVHSSLAGEALAMLDTIGEVVYLKAVMERVFGSRVNDIPVVITTDAQNLFAAIHSTSLVEEAWSITDIAAIKDSLDEAHVHMVKQVSSSEMLANCLTKRGAGAKSLMQVLRDGLYVLPGGWGQVKNA